MNRNQFLQGIGLAAITPAFSFTTILTDPETPLDKKLVQEFVGTSHRDKDKVMELFSQQPNLLNAAHDWGSGDFETALGAASHVGYMELVTWLLEKGAQANIFTACLFGRMDIVRPFLGAFPATLNAKGPHGFTLLHHAERGGENALEVKSYLESLGAKALKIPLK